MNVENNFLEKI